jgi:transcription elongation factor GreA
MSKKNISTKKTIKKIDKKVKKEKLKPFLATKIVKKEEKTVKTRSNKIKEEVLTVNEKKVIKVEEEQKILLTKEGLKKIKEEYDFLTTEKRAQIAQRLQEAIAHGDLSENSEYDDAKNEQAFVEARIRELQEIIENAEIISGAHTTSLIELGCTVHLENLKTKIKEIYKIVGATEANPSKSLISNESPVGKSLMSLSVGESVKVKIPAGIVEYKILKIE